MENNEEERKMAILSKPNSHAFVVAEEFKDKFLSRKPNEKQNQLFAKRAKMLEKHLENNANTKRRK